MANTIKSIVLQDGTELDATALSHIYLNDKLNLYVESDDGKKLTLYSKDNLAVKFNDKIQLDTVMYADDDNKKTARIACICDKAAKVEGLSIEAAGLTFKTESADTTRGWSEDTFKMMFKISAGENDTWTKLNLHAAAIDLRTRATGMGTGGGIAVQIASCDSNLHENKFKIETDRIVDVSLGQCPTSGQYPEYYCGEGGQGIEIGTVNSQFESIYTAQLRRGKDTEVYAASRGALVTSGGKTDYPTQEDDSKDIISGQPFVVKWIDIVNAAAYLKDHGSIPSDGSYYTPQNTRPHLLYGAARPDIVGPDITGGTEGTN